MKRKRKGNVFRTQSDLKDFKKDKNYKRIGYVGEIKVCEQLFTIYGEGEIEISLSSSEGIDIIVYFKKPKKVITIEVKSSKYKEDYIKNTGFYGIPIKTKDFQYNFDLLAMVNFAPNIVNKNLVNFRKDEKCFILYFTLEDLDFLDPNPFMVIPPINLDYLKNLDKESESNYIAHINTFYNNFYKTIILPAEFIFKHINFMENLPSKYSNKISFPKWFGEQERCLYIRDYHKKIKSFYWEHIESNFDKLTNIQRIIDSIKNHSSWRFEENYPISEKNYCLNCDMKCPYAINQR
jgi:hypothetical protein